MSRLTDIFMNSMLLAAAAIALTACDASSGAVNAPSESLIDWHESSKSDSVDSLISSLNAKYGDHFHLIEREGGGAGMVYHLAVYLSSDRFPNEWIYAVKGVFDGKTEIRDNYASYLLHDEASEYLTDIAKSVYGECKVFYEPDKNAVLPPDIGKDSSAAELLKNSKPYFSVLLPEGQSLDQKDEKLDALYEKLKNERINCYLYIAYLDSNKEYVEADTAEISDRSHIIAECTLGIDADFNIVERQWG